MSNTNLRLLIVDDEPMLRSVIREYLEMLGYTDFSTAENGREALGVLRQREIDCMISDIRMPEMELEELLEIVRRDFPDLTVIATSGYSDFSTSSNILRKGADDFLEKPLNLDYLETAVSWIGARLKLFTLARDGFANGATFENAEQVHVALEPLCDELRAQNSEFAGVTRHALRVTELLQRMPLDWPMHERAMLYLAGTLHELGLSCQVFQIISQPRRLEKPEYHLLLHTVETHARLTARRVGLPPLEPLISQHLDWINLLATPADAPFEQRGAVMLGIANSIDGYLQDRPDRPGSNLDSLHIWLDRRRGTSPTPLLNTWLENWNIIENQYTDIRTA